MNNLAPELESFVARSIHSLWALEVLLLLRRDSNRRWTVGELIRTEQATPAIIIDCLSQLRASGLAASDADAHWCYAPDNPQIDLLVQRLAAARRERPLAVLNLILTQRTRRPHSAGE